MPEKTIKRSRCKKGTRKNKKTGKCESVLENTCAICLERIITGNVKTKCKHNFHKKCLIGWCKSQGHLTSPPCPICRSNIKDTCKKIIPFDSQEVFRYTSIAGADDKRKTHHIEQIGTIISNPDFDVNVSNGKSSILYELCYNTYASRHFKHCIEHLLKHPDIVVEDNVVSHLIASKNSDIIALFKKHKKIPKSLKGLV